MTLYEFSKDKFRKLTVSPVEFKTEAERALDCRTYWGSHGCQLPRGHVGHHECDCCECVDHEREHKASGCVGRFPYYGPQTQFYGEDAEMTLAENEGQKS